jgi:hypothetical protein
MMKKMMMLRMKVQPKKVQKKRKKREIVSEINKLKFYVEKKKVPNILYCSKE